VNADARSINNAEIELYRCRQRLAEGVSRLINSVPSRMVSPGMLVAAATVGVVLEHSRGRPPASLMRTIRAISNAARVIARWEQRPRDDAYPASRRNGTVA